MSAPSFNPPRFAYLSPPAAAVLISALRQNGYAPRSPLTAVQLSRALYEIGEWLEYLGTEIGAPFELEHTTAAGTDAYGNALSAGVHTDITCDSLSVRGSGVGAGGGGTLSFPQAGLASDNTCTIQAGALGSGTCIVRLDHPANDAIEVELSGGVWRSTLGHSATWAMECNTATDDTLFVRNIGAGAAGLDVEGEANVQGLLTVGSTADVQGLLTVAAGMEATGPDGTSDVRIGYGATGITLSYDVSPYNGGWFLFDSVIAGTVGAQLTDNTGSPPYVATGTSNGDLFTLRCPVPGLSENITDGHGSGTLYRVTGLGVRYERTGAATTLSIKLNRVARDGSASPFAVLSWDQAGEFTVQGTGSFTLYSDNTLSLDLDPSTYSYQLQLTASVGSAGQAVRVSDCYLRLRKLGVE